METLGEKLRNLRQQKGISLEEIAHITKIKVSSLEAIEADDYDRLPSKIYTKSFIKLYASHLGLDSNELIKEYVTSVPEAKLQDNKIFSIQQPITCQRRVQRTPMRRILIAVACVALLAGLVFALWPHRTSRLAKKSVSSAVGFITSSKILGAGGYLYQFPEGETPPRELRIEALGSVWVSVKTPDSALFEGVLNFGARESWSFSGDLTVKIADPENIKLYVNGNLLSIFRSGVTQLTIDSKGVKIAADAAPLPTAAEQQGS